MHSLWWARAESLKGVLLLTERQGYIAERSGHSRGSTVDVTLCASASQSAEEFKLAQCYTPEWLGLKDPQSLDMGTGFDAFDPQANFVHPGLPAHVLTFSVMLWCAHLPARLWSTGSCCGQR
jgi:D-alanyl-D-alanine dipeptidase